MVKVILFLAFVLVSWKGSIQVEVKKTVPILDGDKIHLYCDEKVSLDKAEAFENFPKTINIKTVVIDSCPPPSHGSYADVLTQLNINITEIRTLLLVNPRRTETYSNYNDLESEPRRPQSQHFSRLNLEEFQILNGNAPAALEMDLKFLSNLTNLTKLTIDNCDIRGSFPNTTKLERVELSGGSFYGDIGACQGFKILHLTDINIFGGKDKNNYKKLKDCEQLQELKLEKMDRVDCEIYLLRSLSKTLRNITVRNCNLDEFPDSYALFIEQYSSEQYDEKFHDFILKHLDVSHNNMKSVSFLSTHKALETLDISHNDLNGGMYYLPNLVKLNVDHNDFESYCDGKLPYYRLRPDNDYLRQLPLRQLSASGTGMRALCFDSMQLSHLQLLNLTHNNINVLDYRKLYNVSGGILEVDLRHNPLERVAISQEDYEALKRNDSSVSSWHKLRILTHARFPCNCSNAWFARAIREKLLTIEGATCDDGTPLELPRLSYALGGCSAACEGDTGCSTANTLHNFMNVKDQVVSVFTEQNSLWWTISRAYDNFWNKLF